MQKILRIIDANFNRAREGLRVIEDSFRFIYQDKNILNEIRRIRHNFSRKMLLFFPSNKLKSARFANEDKGKMLNRKDKLKVNELIETNFFRIEEALRVLEEYSKVLNPKIFEFFHNTRFNIYDVEKKVMSFLNRKKIKVPSVYVILNLKEEYKNFFKFAEKVIRGKPDIIQLRYKGDNTKFFIKCAKELKKIISDEIIYIINDRIDIGTICESDGIHIGQNDINIEDARKLLPDKIIGVSASNLREVKKLKNKDIDYIAIGAIFKSSTKVGKKVTGTDILRKVRKLISIPIIGIGGINIENCNKVIEEGADGIAVISAVENSDNPEEVVKRLREEVYKAWKKREGKIQ
ncbi:MAG: thiamine phosphate synthase [Candidatus Omnitrophica bacterium]|nr:thiamine phosphate synthase [Candidatus Omnitrophota bacterium]